jgi:stage V sporulation protein AE
MKKRVIIVTDGDKSAQKAVETAATNIGGRCISCSAGNPTMLSGSEIIKAIDSAESDLVVVMVDDRGKKGKGKGEQVMEQIFDDENIDVIGVVAVSSNGKDCSDISADCSITNDGRVTALAVDKNGVESPSHDICGDTLSILRQKKPKVIIGLGDPGKMDFNDEVSKGAPLTTRALEEVVQRSAAAKNVK